MADDEVLHPSANNWDTDWRAVAHGIDGELDRLREVVTEARATNWRRGDVVEPELGNFLARLVESSPGERCEQTASLACEVRPRHNSWRHVMDLVG